jgi:hypothetical protein
MPAADSCQRTAGSPGGRTRNLPAGGHQNSCWADTRPPGRRASDQRLHPIPSHRVIETNLLQQGRPAEIHPAWAIMVDRPGKQPNNYGPDFEVWGGSVGRRSTFLIIVDLRTNQLSDALWRSVGSAAAVDDSHAPS